MLNFDAAIITNCILHRVGNAHGNESSIFSNKEITLDAIHQTELKKLLVKNFKAPVLANQFIHSVDIEQNTLFKISENMFAENIDFKLASIQIVKYLFDQSTHHAIKAGEVFILKLSNVSSYAINSDAIAILKIENLTKFIQPNLEGKNYSMQFEQGIIAKNIEKACIIFNYNFDEGFDVYSFEKNSGEANYWNKDFLSIKRKSDDYNSTNVLLDSMKEFIHQDIGDIGFSKKEKISLYNKSIESLADQEASLFIADFIEENLPNKAAQEKYLSFLNDYQDAHNIHLHSEINISKDAVQYQLKRNKSVLKLDKNFHIYIHGDESLIESGQDADGRKYYKLYFNEEH